MLYIHIDTLAALNRERYDELVKEAQIQRLLRVQSKEGDPDHLAGAMPPVRTTVADVLRRAVLIALPARFRAAMPR